MSRVKKKKKTRTNVDDNDDGNDDDYDTCNNFLLDALSCDEPYYLTVNNQREINNDVKLPNCITNRDVF